MNVTLKHDLEKLARQPMIEALHKRLTAGLARTLEEAVTIQQIPAPTFAEGKRAAYVHQRFDQLALDSVEVDALHNVYGRLRGSDPTLPAILLAAHTDTVFEADTKLDVRRENGFIYGPGLGDNSLGVAAVLAMADLLHDQRCPADIWFVANSREEGLGDLGGIRAVCEKLTQATATPATPAPGKAVGMAIIVEGMAFAHIYHAGIAVRRLQITCQTAGGHSWLHFGSPSAVHHLMQLGAEITTILPPTTPRTTYNIGVISGGQSVNSIASRASMLLDMRSEAPLTLQALETQVRAMVEQHRAPDVEWIVKVVGDRPSGAIPRTHPLVELARAALAQINAQPIFGMGSTDANVPLAAGLPAVTVGITRGGNAHRLDEYIETASVQDGLWQLLLLVVGAANGLANPR